MSYVHPSFRKDDSRDVTLGAPLWDLFNLGENDRSLVMPIVPVQSFDVGVRRRLVNSNHVCSWSEEAVQYSKIIQMVKECVNLWALCQQGFVGFARF